MIKALDALNKVKEFKDDCCMFGSSDIEIDKELDIIETALKDYNDLIEYVDTLQGDRDYWWNVSNKKVKELKALEIIKRLINKSGIENWIYETENDYVFADFRISKDEFDLLEEVLL